MGTTAKPFATGFAFTECPRWHDGAFWFSDQMLNKVFRLSSTGEVAEAIDAPTRPSGLGWLPNGDLVVVAMRERQLNRLNGGAFKPYASLEAVHRAYSNDMVIDGKGNAYVGALGYDHAAGESLMPTSIAHVAPDGKVTAAASDLRVPNGMGVTADGRTLIVAESAAARLTAFDIGANGALTNRRIFAELDGAPDGMCVDAEGAVWTSLCNGATTVRVTEGGKVTDTVTVESAKAYACMLGGADGRDLFICCAPTYDPENAPRTRPARIDVARVAVPRGGWP